MPKNILLLQEGSERSFPVQSVFKKLDVDDYMRILAGEYVNIDGGKEYFTHFNFEKTDFALGQRCVLPRLLRHGKKSPPAEKEEQPLLLFQDVYIGECVRVEKFVPYSKLTPDDFKYSMSGIEDIASLKKIILDRYSPSMPDISEEEIFARGVAITTIRICDFIGGQILFN